MPWNFAAAKYRISALADNALIVDQLGCAEAG